VPLTLARARWHCPAFVLEWRAPRDASWTFADTGMLVAILGMFANRDAGLIIGAHFETDGGGDDVLVTPRMCSSDTTRMRTRCRAAPGR
jgi:hypothetical protein